eukprot:3151485-Pyramimonas_sp.AAC.1
MLRHEIHYKKFQIKQFNDRRINARPNSAQHTWNLPSNWKSFQDMVQWKFQERALHNGPSTEAAMAHFKKDGEPYGYMDWTDYYPIFVIRAFQKHIDPQKNRIAIYAKPVPDGGDPSCFNWNSVIAIRCVGGHRSIHSPNRGIWAGRAYNGQT